MSLTPEEWAAIAGVEVDFNAVNIDALKQSPDVESTETAQVFDYILEKQRAKISRIKGENDMRAKFFGWSSKLTAWVVTANVAIFAAYLGIQAFTPGKIPDAVMLSWIASTVLEMLGIVAIIARHLFPGKKRNVTPSK